MAKHLLLAFTNPVPGREDEYNDWYNNIGMPHFKSMPGVIPLGRFRLSNVRMRPSEWDGKFEYLSLYYFEADDAAAYIASLREVTKGRSDYKLSDAIDPSTFFEPLFVALDDDQVNITPIDRYEPLQR